MLSETLLILEDALEPHTYWNKDWNTIHTYWNIIHTYNDIIDRSGKPLEHHSFRHTIIYWKTIDTYNYILGGSEKFLEKPYIHTNTYINIHIQDFKKGIECVYP